MERSEILIIGGGNAGISLAARLIRDGARDVTVVAPQPVHRYKPLLNYVGAGQATMADLERPMADVVPDGCRWIRDSVEAVDPAAMTVRTRGGRTLHGATLVICPGLVEDWEATPGLQLAYADGWAASTYVPGSAPQVWPRLSSLRGGAVVFTVPPEPASCGPTALKPLLMACDHWERAGVLPNFQVRLLLPAASATGLPEADRILERTFADYGIEVLREARVESVEWDVHALTVATSTGRQVLEDVVFAHAVPHYRAPRWIADASLAVHATPGLVDIDPQTLRSRRHESIWAIGDAADVGTRPSGGALRKQVDVLAQNLIGGARGKALQRYDGYTVMPITVSRRKLMLNEVDRDGRARPSVPFLNPFTSRRWQWLFDRYGLPQVYWRRILRGRV
ncbi:sulfide:quinone oxidoreductase [Blastococcus colisei]|uniref:Sulfide:quinone oxidoreductase n=1 Tax=Blastococcus colisei TaxID=1564162 RepID=A0A543P0D5_9ACTN|nr:FAD/NAD(P)-binding oxidoreductase [Blastococcus colisei]TQN37430.1 sulfide:quinone oxidoreductase [Blastococcus colisei]